MSVVYCVRDSGSNARYEGLGYECVVKGGDLGKGIPKNSALFE